MMSNSRTVSFDCPICGVGIAEAGVCGGCVNELGRILRHLAVRLPDLRLLAAKKASVMAREAGHGTRTVAPIPLNANAWQLQQSIEKFAVMLAAALGLPHRRLPAESLLKGAAQRADILMQRKDARYIHRLASIAARRLDRQLEPPESRILIGQCPDCGDDIWSSEADLAAGYQPCACGQTLDLTAVQEQRVLKLAISNARGTAAALSKVFKGCGIAINRLTITQWKRRGIIAAVGDQDGRPVFLLWDVWRAYKR
ncbi:hypothetical protein [Bifidobacterium psychraerophilum]|jgi:predicted RNA-binding Zn-ribbon protein involved in translation (DUF1610 family)|uniref:hypothetical protein n=1 Tax=Bifidobacterium psychraerophilum TaxID=218140 RepID=UPI0023F032BA|nr:hypothetical protein [Bifidobacterium psychraerophilum]MCI1660064.1 hypothetical protein [Bifidobacterium psychraerophilum]MCI1804938.1 hypothetical protein [Bifidobacterium psychraerophilum]MCI2177216.1 hypothetical protein [Bifidobacterium psychraerophilum]MCI2183030.1 hypothetical protein [Bifidobacterium psychraerophilum]